MIREEKNEKRNDMLFSHSQRSGCQREKTIDTLYGGQSRSWSAEQGKESKKTKSDIAQLSAKE